MSYGFRPGRSCHDAIARIFLLARRYGRKRWVLDADIKGAFDEISHAYLLKQLGSFPARELVKQWLKAGVMEEGQWHPTDKGVPQGGVISPVLLNVALHGMEEALGVYYNSQGAIHRNCKITVIRYADDFVVFVETEAEALRAREQLCGWLAERGLSLSEEKTRIVHLTEGFDFLGFNVRQYRTARRDSDGGWVLLIKPSANSVKKFRSKVKELWKALRGHNVRQVLLTLNPVLRGWANYFKIGVAKKVFSKLDAWMFRRQCRWAKWTHPKKNWKWLKNRYWGKLNSKRRDKWVFGDKKMGIFLHKLDWTAIRRHVPVTGGASPDDPSLKSYWQERQRKKLADLSARQEKLARPQKRRCPACGESLHNGELLHEHHIVPRDEGGEDQERNLVLVHLYCHQQLHAKRAERRKRSPGRLRALDRTLKRTPQQLAFWPVASELEEAMQFA